MMLCYSKTRKIKYFLDPSPPPKKKGQRHERSRYFYTHKCLSIQAARDLDIHYVEIEQIECFGLKIIPLLLLSNYSCVFFRPSFQHL